MNSLFCPLSLFFCFTLIIDGALSLYIQYCRLCRSKSVHMYSVIFTLPHCPHAHQLGRRQKRWQCGDGCWRLQESDQVLRCQCYCVLLWSLWLFHCSALQRVVDPLAFSCIFSCCATQSSPNSFLITGQLSSQREQFGGPQQPVRSPLAARPMGSRHSGRHRGFSFRAPQPEGFVPESRRAPLRSQSKATTATRGQR